MKYLDAEQSQVADPWRPKALSSRQLILIPEYSPDSGVFASVWLSDLLQRLAGRLDSICGSPKETGWWARRVISCELAWRRLMVVGLVSRPSQPIHPTRGHYAINQRRDKTTVFYI